MLLWSYFYVDLCPSSLGRVRPVCIDSPRYQPISSFRWCVSVSHFETVSRMTLAPPHRFDHRAAPFAHSCPHASNDENQIRHFLPHNEKNSSIWDSKPSSPYFITRFSICTDQATRAAAIAGMLIFPPEHFHPLPLLATNARAQHINPSLSPGTVYAMQFGTVSRIGP